MKDILSEHITLIHILTFTQVYILEREKEDSTKTCSFILVFNSSIIVSGNFSLIVTDLTFYSSSMFLFQCQFLLLNFVISSEKSIFCSELDIIRRSLTHLK